MSGVEPAAAPERAVDPAAGPTCPGCGALNRARARFCRGCGLRLTEAALALPAPRPASDGALVEHSTPGEQGLAAATAPNAPAMRRQLRRRLLLIAAALLALLAVVGVVNLIQATRYAPDRPVQRMFAALAAKDVDTVNEVTSCSGQLCERGAFDMGYEPPTDLEIRSVSYGPSGLDDPARLPSRSQAVVAVRYRVGGQTFDDLVGVHRTGSGLFRDWTISDPPGWMVLLDSAHVPKAMIGGASVPTTMNRRPGDLGSTQLGKVWALPGIYTITPTPTPLYDSDPVTLVVGGRRPEHRVDLPIRIKPGVQAEVNRQVKERIDACATQPHIRPDIDPSPLTLDDCPFSASDRHTSIRDIRWTVTRYPQLELAINPGGAVDVRTAARGEAVISYEWTTGVVEPRTWTPYREAWPIEVGGRVTVTEEGNVIWSPRGR